MHPHRFGTYCECAKECSSNLDMQIATVLDSGMTTCACTDHVEGGHNQHMWPQDIVLSPPCLFVRAHYICMYSVWQFTVPTQLCIYLIQQHVSHTDAHNNMTTVIDAQKSMTSSKATKGFIGLVRKGVYVCVCVCVCVRACAFVCVRARVFGN